MASTSCHLSSLPDRPSAMEAACEHSDVCGRDALDGHDGKCRLHSEDSEKDKDEFEEALEEHREEHGPDFRWMIFPDGLSFSVFDEKALFSQAVFRKGANFSNAEFREGASFSGATFQKGVDSGPISQPSPRGMSFVTSTSFHGATFDGKAIFSDAEFEEAVSFLRTTFNGKADFWLSTFGGKVHFFKSIFENEADFTEATFEGKVNFVGGTTFKSQATFTQTEFGVENSPISGEGLRFSATFEENANFAGAIFHSDTTFEGFSPRKGNFDRCHIQAKILFSRDGEDQTHAGSKLLFTEVNLLPGSSLQFQNSDLSRCRFRGTNLREIEFTGVKWCEEVSSDGWLFDEWFRRVGLYDEAYESESEDTPPWSEIERLYRQLKRNYEERGDFPRAGDFHMGEKIARRQNSQTHWGAQLLLFAYRALSKYGERALPAFLWLLFVVFVCAGAYAAHPCTEGYFEALRLSTQATFFPVQPVELEGPSVGWVNLFQRTVSPLILFLLALALRQRVKR